VEEADHQQDEIAISLHFPYLLHYHHRNYCLLHNVVQLVWEQLGEEDQVFLWVEDLVLGLLWEQEAVDCSELEEVSGPLEAVEAVQLSVLHQEEVEDLFQPLEAVEDQVHSLVQAGEEYLLVVLEDQEDSLVREEVPLLGHYLLERAGVVLLREVLLESVLLFLENLFQQLVLVAHVVLGFFLLHHRIRLLHLLNLSLRSLLGHYDHWFALSLISFLFEWSLIKRFCSSCFNYSSTARKRLKHMCTGLLVCFLFGREESARNSS
jgi:hypothetical protein